MHAQTSNVFPFRRRSHVVTCEIHHCFVRNMSIRTTLDVSIIYVNKKIKKKKTNYRKSRKQLRECCLVLIYFHAIFFILINKPKLIHLYPDLIKTLFFSLGFSVNGMYEVFQDNTTFYLNHI